MIRTRHDIDTFLVNIFIGGKNFDSHINEALLNWLSSLGNKDHQDTRNKAIRFIEMLALDVLGEINYPVEARSALVKTFEPLELLLRNALALKDYKGNSSVVVRDHLSHTVRNILFTNYLINAYGPAKISTLRRQLFIAAIFHDIAYPIEKIKKVANRLGDATFRDLVDTKGSISITLNNPNDLLSVLNYFDEVLRHYVDLNTNSHDSETAELVAKLTHLYVEIVSKAVAGKGLFDCSHSISSVVLLLRPIVKHWNTKADYQNLGAIADICLAMTYHDRENDITSIPGECPLIARIMRLSDELQEWDRESDAFTRSVKISEDHSTKLSMEFVMGHKTKQECDPLKVLPDKLRGIQPVVVNEKLKVTFEFPVVVAAVPLKKALPRLKGHKITIHGKRGKKVEMLFEQNKTAIKLN